VAHPLQLELESVSIIRLDFPEMMSITHRASQLLVKDVNPVNAAILAGHPDIGHAVYQANSRRTLQD
jgi:hypothetical protein